MKKFFEELSKIGLIGLIFGSGNVSKRNFIGFALIILSAVAIVSAWKDNFETALLVVTVAAVLVLQVRE